MPRILRIINRLNLGGPTFNAGILTKYLAPEFETMLLAGMKDESEASSEFIINDLGLKPTYIPEMYREINLAKDREAYKKIKQKIKEFKPDIVHTHAAKAGTLGRLAASACKVPVIMHTFHGHVFHSYFSRLKTNLFINIERYLARKCTKIIAISPGQKKELVEKYKIAPAEKVEVVQLGFDLGKFHENPDIKRNEFRSTYGLKEDEIAIGIIGRLVPIKNHAMFLRAIKEAKQHTDKKIKAFIIGDGECRQEIENTCQDLQLQFGANGQSDVVFTSWIKDIDVAAAGLDIIALTSFNEGTPVSLIEAQAASRPIVTTNVGGVADTVVPDKSAYLVELNEETKMAHYFIDLIKDPALRQKMGTEGHDYVKNKYHYNTLVNNFSKLYNSLLNNKL